MPLTPFDAPLPQIAKRLDETRQLVAYHDTLRKHVRASEMTRASRAWAYVSLAAALEAFVRDFVDEMAIHINAANLPVTDLRLSVVSLLQTPAFDSVAANRRQTMWDRRVELLESGEGTGIVRLLVGLRPLDGRTIRREHLESLWKVYGIAGPALPGPLHGLALKDLADGRNEVAHGNSDPIAFGRGKTYYDVIRRIQQVEDIALHIAASGATYVAAGNCRR